MKSIINIVIIGALCVSIASVVGCGSSNTVKGGAIGAGAGGAVGAAVGYKLGNTAVGAIIGAAVGGTAGVRPVPRVYES